MRRRTFFFLMLAAGLVLLAGLGRLRLDVNVFNLLPAHSPMVDGLRLYQRNFGASRELILSVRARDAGSAQTAVDDLADTLHASGLTGRTIRRSPFRDDPAQLAELLAYLWFNQPPDAFRRMAGKLRPDRLHTTLDGTLQRMATSFQPMEIARLSRDPFALTDLPEQVRSPMANLQHDPFASPQGDFRIFFAAPPFESEGFWAYRRWVAEVEAAVRAWQGQFTASDPPVVRLSGTPAFVARTGSGLMRDMLTACLGTLGLVAGLFWLAYRKWSPLIWLVSLLVLILLATVAAGSLILGPLNAVSLGFAAILLGLAADYGLILYQEHICHPLRPVARLRRETAPSILWAAGTTAGAFFWVGRSSLPGLTQLGMLVGIGILMAAGVMLAVFLPVLTRRAGAPAEDGTGRSVWLPPRMMRPVTLWSVTWLVAACAVAVLLFRQPAWDYSTRNLGPRVNPPQAALDEIQSEIGGFEDALWLMLSGDDERQVAARLAHSANLLDDAVGRGVLTGYQLPTALWPHPDFQNANRRLARQLTESYPPARQAALDAGFAPSALRLTDEMVAAWRDFVGTDKVARPSRPGALWVFRQFAGQDAGRQLVLGKLDAAPGAPQADLLALAGQMADAVQGRLFGWSLLSESLMTVMQRDTRQVLAPMSVAMLLLLGFAFRSAAGVFLSLAVLCFGLVSLMSLMALFGGSWNLMNVMALPLLLGAGVDYSIHIQFALKRHAGDARQVRQTVGRAILLCGASTASGFGTLGLAGNAGVASLGRVCAAGILITALTAVYLLPVWWGALHRKTAMVESAAEK